MADAKTTDLPVMTTPVPADVIPIVNDVGGVPVTQQIAVSNLIPSYVEFTAESGVTVVNWNYPFGNVLRYGTNISPGISDMTVAIQAAVDVVYAAGGGDVIIPAGNYGVTSVARVWSGAVSVNIRGAGKTATILTKIGVTTTPVLDFSAASLQTPYMVISDLEIVGNAKVHDGIRVTLLARFSIQRVSIFTCDTALDSLGSLIFSASDVTCGSNNIGYMCRASGGIECNLVQFYSSQITGSSTYGVDIGDADNVLFNGCDFEGNGTTSDTSTGAVVIRDTIDDQAAYATISFTNTWFENNKGRAIEVEAATGATVHFTDVHMFAATADGNQLSVGAIRLLQLDNYYCYGTGAGITTAATTTIIQGGVQGVYTDNSTTTFISSSIYTKSISATGAISDTGQIGTFGFLSAAPGLASVGAFNYDAAKTEPLNLFCSHVQQPGYTDAQLNDVGHVVNTDPGKVQGCFVFNDSQNKPVYAVGSSDAALWVDGAGTTTNTPV